MEKPEPLVPEPEEVYEEVDLPSDEDISDYEVVTDDDDPTDPVRAGQWNQKI
jgi:hypothetical protein